MRVDRGATELLLRDDDDVLNRTDDELKGSSGLQNIQNHAVKTLVLVTKDGEYRGSITNSH